VRPAAEDRTDPTPPPDTNAEPAAATHRATEPGPLADPAPPGANAEPGAAAHRATEPGPPANPKPPGADAEPGAAAHRATEPGPPAPPANPKPPGADAEPDRRERAGWERVIGWLLPGSNPAGAVYGMIAVGALLAAESGLHDNYLETVGSVLVALALYWLAHAYAELLGRRWRTREHLTASALWRALARDWTIMRGATSALIALAACWAAGASQETAVTIAIWTTAGSLVVYELAAGVRARSRPAELLLEGCVGAAMGVGVLALRVILH
jgi:hypothetical protein